MQRVEISRIFGKSADCEPSTNRRRRRELQRLVSDGAHRRSSESSHQPAGKHYRRIDRRAPPAPAKHPVLRRTAAPPTASTLDWNLVLIRRPPSDDHSQRRRRWISQLRLSFTLRCIAVIWHKRVTARRLTSICRWNWDGILSPFIKRWKVGNDIFPEHGEVWSILQNYRDWAHLWPINSAAHTSLYLPLMYLSLSINSRHINCWHLKRGVIEGCCKCVGKTKPPTTAYEPSCEKDSQLQIPSRRWSQSWFCITSVLFEHICTMSDTGVVKTVMLGMTDGIRPRGRSPRRRGDWRYYGLLQLLLIRSCPAYWRQACVEENYCCHHWIQHVLITSIKKRRRLTVELQTPDWLFCIFA